MGWGVMSQVGLTDAELQQPAVPVQTEAFTMALDWLAGGVSGCIAKTATAPIERVKLLIQTQAANPRIMSGEVEAYSGMANTTRRVCAEQGFRALWRGNVPNCIRFFPTQAFNFAFKDRYAVPSCSQLLPRVPLLLGAGYSCRHSSAGVTVVQDKARYAQIR